MEKNEELLFWKALVALLVKESKNKKETKDKNQKVSTKDFLAEALERQRILPGASLIRKGRPMTDLLARIKKKQRRAVKGEAIKFRGKFLKGPQRALVTKHRKKARKAYHKS
jgi:hypothetical protein